MSITFELDGTVTLDDESAPGRRQVIPAGTAMADVDAQCAAFFGVAPKTAPDNPTLGDWRVGLALWTRQDASGATVTRLTDVTNAVAAMMASTDPRLAVMGQVAHQRLEYSNNVLKAEITQLAAAFQFTADDAEESFWRADRVRQGDLSGAWPLPGAAT